MHKKRKIYKTLLLVVFLISLLYLNQPVLAENGTTPNGTVTLNNPIGGTNPTDPSELIGRVIKAVLGIVGSLALIMFIYGGITWMTSMGNKDKIEKGKNIIIWAVIGLVVVFGAYAMVSFVLKEVIGVSSNSGN